MVHIFQRKPFLNCLKYFIGLIHPEAVRQEEAVWDFISYRKFYSNTIATVKAIIILIHSKKGLEVFRQREWALIHSTNQIMMLQKIFTVHVRSSLQKQLTKLLKINNPICVNGFSQQSSIISSHLSRRVER